MELKDKLNLLWKYLLLVLLAYVVISHHCRSKYSHGKGHNKYGCAYSKGGHDFSSHGENVEVEVIIENGDTAIVVEIDGRQLSVDEAKTYIVDTVAEADKIKKIIKNKIIIDTK